MNKHLLVSAMALALTACGSTAIMDKSAAVKAQPELNIKTDNNLWKLGREGTFDIAGMYKGKYSRSASSSQRGSTNCLLKMEKWPQKSLVTVMEKHGC